VTSSSRVAEAALSMGAAVRFVLAAALGLALAASGASRVAPAWLPPDEVSAPQESVRFPSVAVSRTGEVLTVYGGSSGVEALFRAPGGTGTSWARLATCGGNPQVAIDDAGDAIVLWLECSERGDRVMAGVRTAGLLGTWQAPVALSTRGRLAVEPVLAVNGRGDAVASWGESDGEFWVVQASTRSGASGMWEPAVQLSSTGAYAYESVSAIDERGDVVVGFTRSDPAGPIVWSSYRPAGGSWLGSVQLSQPGHYGIFPAVALDGQGNAIAVWSEDGNGASSFRSRPTAVWEAAGPFPSGNWTHIAIDSRGNSLAAWEQAGGVWVSDRPAGSGSRWADAVSVTNAEAIAVHVAFDDADNAVVLWGRYGQSYPLGSISAARRSTGSPAWESPVILESVSAEMDWVRYAVDPRGDAVAVWEDEAWPRGVRSAVLDAAGPVVESLRVPSTAKVGRVARFEARIDDLSRTTLQWQFGDRRSAQGRTVRHAYRRPGTYTVRVIATDAVGHRGSMSQRIRITR
jgi:hypothetical protein